MTAEVTELATRYTSASYRTPPHDCARNGDGGTVATMIDSRMTTIVFALLLIGVAANAQVINLGFPGANTAELEAGFSSVLALHPRIIVIMAGANDALNPAKLLPPDVSRKYLQAMATRTHAAGAQVMLVTLHDPDLTRLLSRHAPTEYGDRPPEQRVFELNRVLREVARQNGILLVDFHAVLHANGGATIALSTDGLHLTRKGYALLASAVRAQLPQHVLASDTIVCFGDSLTYGIGVRAPGGAPETDGTYPAQLHALLMR
jgi:lysophospholipase L1-like esterase